MRWTEIPSDHRTNRVALVAALLLLYALLFVLLYPSRGAGVASLGLLPAAVGGWALGVGGGMLVGVLAALLPLPLLAGRSEPAWQLLFGGSGGFESLLLVAVGIGLGWVGQTNRALHQAREQSEALLDNMMPRAVAERLKREPRLIAEQFDEATVLFADIVNFSSLAGGLSPKQLIRLLNELFSDFDALADHHGVEKIKTIGDTYMAVAGVPTVRPDHAEAAAEMALAMLESLAHFNERHSATLQLRVGLASGPVVAGVIGTRKYSYDLWGDTVNVASRMESHGLPGHIQLSSRTRERLPARFHVQKRGRIEIKGKGPMTTHLLMGLREPTTRRG